MPLLWIAFWKLGRQNSEDGLGEHMENGRTIVQMDLCKALCDSY